MLHFENLESWQIEVGNMGDLPHGLAAKNLNFRENCQEGTCASGLCAVNNPSDYSLGCQCGPPTGDKKCGGTWGSCCGTNNHCGSGPKYCNPDNCDANGKSSTSNTSLDNGEYDEWAMWT